MAKNFGPSRCPRCGERQNRMPGGFDPDAEPFGHVQCMACGHRFTRREFLAGLEEPARPEARVVPFPGRGPSRKT
jgi:DNA-directed RNA polymerase subunit RPC12/RpoP